MQHSPLPFLHRIFSAGTWPKISEGWIYSAQEAEVYGGYTNHQAIDFTVPAETPVRSAASGIALASFEEVPIRYPGPEPRVWRGDPVFWGHGLHIVILHKNNFVTVYAHFHRLAPAIRPAFIQPILAANGDVLSALSPLQSESAAMQLPAVRVKAGQVLGYAGITGMGWGRRTYDNWLNNKTYRSNDEVHVHFAVSSLPALALQTTYIDPLGIYGYAKDYPPYKADWSVLPGSLWLN